MLKPNFVLKICVLVLAMVYLIGCGGGGGSTPPKPTTYTLTVTIEGHGSVTGVATEGKYVAGSVATIRVVPVAGHAFDTWKGNHGSEVIEGVVNDTFQITMSQNKTIEAHFGQATSYNQTIVVDEGTPSVILPDVTVSGLPGGVTLSVQPVPAEEKLAILGGEQAAGELLQFSVDRLDKPVELRIGTTNDNAVLSYYNATRGKWEMVSGSTVVTIQGKLYVKAMVSHFSVYGPVVKTPSLVAASITEASNPAKDATVMVMPSVPTGYTLSIHSSSVPKVISTNGTITPPDKSTAVSLVFKITQGSISAYTDAITVLVPAKTYTAPEIDTVHAKRLVQGLQAADFMTIAVSMTDHITELNTLYFESDVIVDALIALDTIAFVLAPIFNETLVELDENYQYYFAWDGEEYAYFQRGNAISNNQGLASWELIINDQFRLGYETDGWHIVKELLADNVMKSVLAQTIRSDANVTFDFYVQRLPENQVIVEGTFDLCVNELDVWDITQIWFEACYVDEEVTTLSGIFTPTFYASNGELQSFILDGSITSDYLSLDGVLAISDIMHTVRPFRYAKNASLDGTLRFMDTVEFAGAVDMEFGAVDNGIIAMTNVRLTDVEYCDLVADWLLEIDFFGGWDSMGEPCFDYDLQLNFAGNYHRLRGHYEQEWLQDSSYGSTKFILDEYQFNHDPALQGEIEIRLGDDPTSGEFGFRVATAQLANDSVQLDVEITPTESFPKVVGTMRDNAGNQLASIKNNTTFEVVMVHFADGTMTSLDFGF